MPRPDVDRGIVIGPELDSLITRQTRAVQVLKDTRKGRGGKYLTPQDIEVSSRSLTPGEADAFDQYLQSGISTNLEALREDSLAHLCLKPTLFRHLLATNVQTISWLENTLSAAGDASSSVNKELSDAVREWSNLPDEPYPNQP